LECIQISLIGTKIGLLNVDKHYQLDNLTSGTYTRAQISKSAIERLYISMRHLLIRGHYKPLGISGKAMIESLLSLKPEIYGSIADEERVEIDGLHYVYQRLPQGIEQCRFIKLISREGFESSSFTPIIPAKRRRNCYRVDASQMLIEMTRGRSDIYDVLTHLTFLYIESEKIRRNSLDQKNRKKREWKKLKEINDQINSKKKVNIEVGCSYLSTLIGRTYKETLEAIRLFDKTSKVNSLFQLVYWMSKLSIDQFVQGQDREITFSSSLRDVIGHHIYGEQWADRIKKYLRDKGLHKKKIHIVSANLHSVMNCFFATSALKKIKAKSFTQLMNELSKSGNGKMRTTVKKYALSRGMHELTDESGSNITVQIFDCEQINMNNLVKDLGWKKSTKVHKDQVILLMDYAFGEQAYETMDELLKPVRVGNKKEALNVKSINIMGKAGILQGKKGDIMIPHGHIFEGTADNYPFKNELNIKEFEGRGLGVYSGTMITVLGTSLQNKDIMRYFLESSWKGIGLEMEGAHYQKAIQAASKIRKHIDKNVKLRYAYYASDNPLETGSTLASGSLGLDGVEPTYLITSRILNGIMI